MQDYDPWIAGIAKPGTLVKVTRIELRRNFEMGEAVEIAGRLLNVAWAGKAADMDFISRELKRDVIPELPMVDKKILELVRKP